jgi:hypothetical protein
MIKLGKILNNKKPYLNEGDVTDARKRVNKALKDLINKEQDYLSALEELKLAANSYYGADQNGPKKDIAIEISTSIKDGAQYTANRNKIGGNNSRHGKIQDLVKKL